MTKKSVTNIAASVRQRLLNKARSQSRPFQELATFYAMERFLFRVGASPIADQLILKGGLMTLTWAGEYQRITRDIDFLGRGVNSIESVLEQMREVLKVQVLDGVVFDPDTLAGVEITALTEYLGVRVSLQADLDGMRINLQIDVGFGDAVVPKPDLIDYPQLLDFGCPRLLGYPAEATLAEKLHAVVNRGLTNSRMKDYYDLWTAQRLGVVSAESLGMAIAHTFQRRETPIPKSLPLGLTNAFVQEPGKQAQWAGFQRKSGLNEPTLQEAVSAAGQFAKRAFSLARESGGES